MSDLGRPLCPAHIYAIADADALDADRLPATVETIAASGIGWIQVRAKHLAGEALYRLVEECLDRLRGSRARLWINDRADLAATLPVAGVHVGQQDLPPAAVRQVVGADCWIGASTHNENEVRAAEASPDVDVVAFGPIFETRSKERPEPTVGLAALRRARRLVTKPLVAIGGIESDTVGRVLAAGADAVAVIGAVCRGDVQRNCRRLLAAAAGAVHAGEAR